MAGPSRKRQRAAQTPTEDKPSVLLSDYRTAWLVSEDQTVELIAKDESLLVHKAVLTRSSEYFRSAFKKPFNESRGTVTFSDIEPRHLALFVGVAYQHSALAPATPPTQSDAPQTRVITSSIQDYVEVYKLCDRFICHDMTKYIDKCLDVVMLDSHRAMFRDYSDSLQHQMMRNFSDGYEALEVNHFEQARIAERLLTLFCGAIHYSTWAESTDLIADRPRFVVEVSKRFATRLGDLNKARKFTRKEIKT